MRFFVLSWLGSVIGSIYPTGWRTLIPLSYGCFLSSSTLELAGLSGPTEWIFADSKRLGAREPGWRHPLLWQGAVSFV